MTEPYPAGTPVLLPIYTRPERRRAEVVDSPSPHVYRVRREDGVEVVMDEDEIVRA